MNTLLAISVSVCFILHNAATEPEGNFILTSPRVIDAGTTAYFTLTVFDVPRGGTVTLQLTHEKSNVLIAENQVEVYNNHNMWVEINVPPMSSDASAKLHVIGSFSNGYQIEDSRKVEIRHNTLLIFIQTDKPLYKPGQTIRFRVLPMDNQLKPLDSNTVGDVWIENPIGIRVAQWKEVKFTEGIKQFDLPLSDEPPLGTWKIKTLIKQVTSTQTFNVQKYVLPKFEVQILLPKIIMADAETISIKICAKYTYGEIVEGNLKAKVTYKKPKSIHLRESSAIPSVEHQTRITGCDIFLVNTDDLLLQTEEFGYSELEVFAEVTENITGIVRNATTSFKTSHEHVKLEFMEDDNFYKPKLPYTSLLQAKKPDGSPATSEKIEICTVLNEKKKCLIFTTNKEGIIQFTIKPPSPYRDIKIDARTINYEDVYYAYSKWTLKLMKSTASKTVHPWFSPSDNYLHIEPSTNVFQCDKAQKVKVYYTAERGASIKFYHQVLSKGRIVQQGSHQRTFYSKADEMQYDFEDESSVNEPITNSTEQTEAGEFILTFDTKATMSPKARLLIFYIRKDREVVADSRKFHIKNCLQNKVSLHFRHEQQYPNTEAAMLLVASPSSLCGISMVDKSIRLLENDNTFGAEKIFKTLESYDTGKQSTAPKMCLGGFSNENMPSSFLSTSHTTHSMQLADASVAFEKAGMTFMTDLKIANFMCPIGNGRIDHDMPVPLMFPVGGVVRRRGSMRKTKQRLVGGEKSITPQEEMRSYFPETWLWELQTVGSSGETAITRQLPHTITEWVGDAVCIHPKTGLGLSDVSRITTFQPFFIDFELPYSVIRGETLSLIVTVFNYLSECLPIKLSLEPSEEYVLLSENRFQKVCVCGGKSTAVRFPLRTTTLGKVNITAYGFSIEQDDEICGNDITARLSARDAITKALLVEAEGFPKEEIFNFFICPENTNGSVSIDVPLLPPDDVVLDSARAYMTVTGDIMGPALNGLKKLVRLPVGCGEQNMILFVPNIFVMDYLSSTGKLTEDIKEECLSNMKTGYQRELRYRHQDGSYSAFGSRYREEKGSLWLTAFVLRSFGQARRFISIDERDLQWSKDWISRLQLENGCFRSIGKVFHKEMKGGLENGGETLAPLTSYILISLLESGAQNPDTYVVKNALKCLEKEEQIDTYALSLFAYASALSRRTEMSTKYLEELDKRAIFKDYLKFWESSSNSKSVAVEIAGYYILARLKLENSTALEKTLPVVRWITQQRNSNGGFVSTQDTVVALQALSTYATYESKKPLDIALSVESDDLSNGFKLDENNKLVTQSLKIPELPTTVDMDAYGDGCAIVQFSLRYNVETAKSSEGLELNVNARRRGSNECNLPSLGICMRYAVYKEKTNMAVLSVKLPSGFAADEWSLQLLANNYDLGLRRHEVNENEVNLYFDEITNYPQCFEFNIKSVFDVEDIKPSIIRLYDYYQPDRQVSKEYLIPSACNATALPDIPWLPLFSPLTQDDNPESSELQGITNVDFQEMQEIPDKVQSQEPLDENKNTSLSDSLVELPSVQNLDDHRGTLEILPNTDFSDKKSSKITSHLSNFADIDKDLDFPDGLEGNIPVSVTPPSDFKEQNCPICSNSFPENFTAVYCNSAFALEVAKKDISKTVKIFYDISFYNDLPKSIKKFAELEYEESCICPQLQETNKVLFITGSPLSLWESSEKKHKLRLTSSVYVLLMPQKQLHSFISEAKTSCADDP